MTVFPEKELVDVLRLLASLRYGLEARHHFKRWGIKSGQDFREIFCRLAESGLLDFGEGASYEEYLRGCDFDKAFPES